MSRWELRGVSAQVGSFEMGPVDLDLAEGEAVAVVGRSGAGKTTLLRAACGLVPLREGVILRDGIDRSTTPPERRGTVFVPQGLGLLPHRTVERNVRYPMELRRTPSASAVVDSLLEEFGLVPFRNRFPGQLSTGQQQRVAVARSLAADPELLLWDEPLSALDVSSRDELLDTLLAVRTRKRIPIVVVTHDASVALSLADRLLLLDAGTVRYSGAVGPLLAAPVDRFAARFLGYENVLSRNALATERTSPFGRWLWDRSGPGGVCFLAAREPRAEDPSQQVWTGTVRRRDLVPGGARLTLAVDGLAIKVFAPFSNGRAEVPGPAQPARFVISERDLKPLGASTDSDS